MVIPELLLHPGHYVCQMTCFLNTDICYSISPCSAYRSSQCLHSGNFCLSSSCCCFCSCLCFIHLLHCTIKSLYFVYPCYNFQISKFIASGNITLHPDALFASVIYSLLSVSITLNSSLPLSAPQFCCLLLLCTSLSLLW